MDELLIVFFIASTMRPRSRGWEHASVRVCAQGVRLCSQHDSRLDARRKTADLATAGRRLVAFRAKAGRLEGEKDRDIRFEELADERLASIKSGLKPKPYDRRRGALVGLMPFFPGMVVKATGYAEIDAWKRKRGATVSLHQEIGRHLRCHRHRLEHAAEIVGNRANSALVVVGDAGTLPKLWRDDDLDVIR